MIVHFDEVRAVCVCLCVRVRARARARVRVRVRVFVRVRVYSQERRQTMAAWVLRVARAVQPER